MRDHYDLASMESRPNPYAGRVKQPVTIRLDKESVDYFKTLSEKLNIPYQTLINLFLADCARRRAEPDLSWHTTAA